MLPLLLALVQLRSAVGGDPFTNRECQSTSASAPLDGKPQCTCRWKEDRSNLQCMGMGKAPAGAQATAALCEAWCCRCTEKNNCKFKDQRGGTGACSIWCWTNPDNPLMPGRGGCYVGNVAKGPYTCQPNAVKGAVWTGGGGGNLGEPSRWGEPFVLGAFACATLYVSGGLIVGQQKGRKELKKMHPHHRGWGKLRGLVVDGVWFTVGKATGSSRKRGYDKVATAAAVAKAQAKAFTKDENVQYYSASKKEWVGATVKKIHSDGRIDLDVKKGVKPDQVRAINVITKIEKVQVVDKKAEKRLKEMKETLKKAKSAVKSASCPVDKERAELEAARAQAALDRAESQKALAAAEEEAKRAGGAKGDGRWVVAKDDGKTVRLGGR